jgi:hypothetical protein
MTHKLDDAHRDLITRVAQAASEKGPGIVADLTSYHDLIHARRGLSGLRGLLQHAIGPGRARRFREAHSKLPH